MKHRMIVWVVLFVTCASFAISSARADEWLESYVAYLSDNDHYNSSGVPLRTAASILAQDRANMHRFSLWDGDDEVDKFFTTTARRQMMSTMLSRGRVSRETRNTIVKFDMMVQVHIWRDSFDRPYVLVELLP